MGTRTKGPRYYTTSKKPSDFISEIFGLLTEFGARSFHVDAEGDGAVGFILEIHGRRIPFRMTPNLSGVRARLIEAGVEKQADHGPEAVAWGQLRHLLELQLEAVHSGILTTEEALGGFAVLSTGETVAEALADPERLLLRSGD